MEMIGPLQIRVMHCIWRDKLTSVHAVHDSLNKKTSKKLAYTTILTVMRNLVKRDILDQQKTGRSHTFLPIITEKEYKRSMLNQVCQTFFSGDTNELIKTLK